MTILMTGATGWIAKSLGKYIEKPIEEVFYFYANEYNLEIITPPFLNFKVLKKNTPKNSIKYFNYGSSCLYIALCF